ncbi:diacylglycerol kinase family protein [Agrococcus sp. TF02-05]|uniref:diacylglycerol/lipid kinase family protein n=1 Tax=Agrococcus sp. TF02-05 TaxID=2815211 RepID=UPI001AA166B7|nr:diacylglycerol kinase family protein [Agrococcus sp. TF02-05]MBO1770832.1 diacylglycerol kinase family lipid kinase [Agrococcus sp. TF02-05]
MRIVVASKPTSAGRAGAVGERVAARLAALGHDVRHIAAADYRGQLEQSRFAMTTADALVVVGGDGMVHLGVNIVGGTSKRLVIVPAGSGNDFAASLGIRSAEQAMDGLEAALAASPERFDLVRIEHPDGVELAAGVVSVGFDADVTVRSNRFTRVPRALRYRAAIAATLLRPRHRTFRMRFDGGEERSWRTLIAAIANNGTFGGGVPIAPSASLHDGRLTAVLADEVSYPRFLLTLAKVLRGRHEADRRLHVRDCESVEIASDDPVTVCADGEMVGRLPVRCTAMPGALQVLRAP